MNPNWTPYILIGCTTLLTILIGFIYFKLDSRYVLKADAEKEAMRLEGLARSEAHRVEKLALEEARRIEEGSKSRWSGSETSSATHAAKLDGIIASRTVHDNQLQTQLASMTTTLGELKGALAVIVPLIQIQQQHNS